MSKTLEHLRLIHMGCVSWLRDILKSWASLMPLASTSCGVILCFAL